MWYRHSRLRSGAHALRLHHDQRTGKADAILYFDRIAGCERTVSASALVIAAGTLATTKLLLDSTCPAFPHG